PATRTGQASHARALAGRRGSPRSFFFSSRRRHTRSVSAFLLNRSSDLSSRLLQNEMLAYQQKESTARVASIMENTNLSKQQQVRSEERRVGKECRSRWSQ